MKVKVGDTVYTSKEQPIMIILTDQDKENIANMLPEATKYCEFVLKGEGKDGAVEFTEDEIRAWMKEVGE